MALDLANLVAMLAVVFAFCLGLMTALRIAAGLLDGELLEDLTAGSFRLDRRVGSSFDLEFYGRGSP